MNEAAGQIYRHYKGNVYVIVGTGHHTENGQHLVYYKRLDGSEGEHIWARPHEMFVGDVLHEDGSGRKVKRFTLLNNHQKG